MHSSIKGLKPYSYVILPRVVVMVVTIDVMVSPIPPVGTVVMVTVGEAVWAIVSLYVISVYCTILINHNL